jgi:hypothetical protein
VISWLGTGVAKVIRLNASEPMVWWKAKHPQSVGWQQPKIDKLSPTLCSLPVTVYELVILCMFQELCMNFLMDILYPFFCCLVA